MPRRQDADLDHAITWPLVRRLISFGQALSEAVYWRSSEGPWMANILPWLFWCASAAVSSLASADLLLLDTQKKWINDRAIEFWNWLDDQRELKYLSYLRKFRWQRFIAILYATVALVALVGVIMAVVMEFSEYLNNAFTKGFTEGFTKGFIKGYGVELAETPPMHVVHSTLGGYLGSFLAALLMAGPVLSRVFNWITKAEGSWAYIGSWFWVMFVTTLAFAMVCFWVLVVVPVIFILLLMALFRAVQFVVVRVAENPKGPQYALSVLLAAVGAGISRFT